MNDRTAYLSLFVYGYSCLSVTAASTVTSTASIANRDHFVHNRLDDEETAEVHSIFRTYHTYNDVLQRLHEVESLSSRFLTAELVDLFRIYNAEPPLCGGGPSAEPCEFPLVRMFPKSAKTETPASHSAVIVSGIHGDEKSGVDVVMALIDLAMHEDEGLDIFRTSLTGRNWELYILPMGCPICYANNTRTDNGTDINRDFPHAGDGKYLQSLSTRILVKLFSDRPFDVVLSVHSGFLLAGHGFGSPDQVLEDLTARWGAKSIPSPDDKVGRNIIEALQQIVPAPAVSFGRLGDIVYPVFGTLEDYVYQHGKVEKALSLLLEVSSEKSPELDNEEKIIDFTKRGLETSAKKRLPLRLMLSYILRALEFLRPQVVFSLEGVREGGTLNLAEVSNQDFMELEYWGAGCVEVNEVAVVIVEIAEQDRNGFEELLAERLFMNRPTPGQVYNLHGGSRVTVIASSGQFESPLLCTSKAFVSEEPSRRTLQVPVQSFPPHLSAVGLVGIFDQCWNSSRQAQSILAKKRQRDSPDAWRLSTGLINVEYFMDGNHLPAFHHRQPTNVTVYKAHVARRRAHV